MKKFIFIISTIILFSAAAFAQTEAETPTEWKTLAPEAEEFSVDAPDSVRFSIFYNQITNSIYDKKQNRRYSGMSGKTYFFIFSDISAYAPQFETALKFVESSQKDELEKQKNSKALKFRFSDDEKFFHTIYAVKTKSRSYIFHTISETENDPGVERFFKSLKINKKSVNIQFKKFRNTDQKTGDVIQEPVKVISENKISAQTKTGSETGIGRGNGIGSGKGNGQGSGFGIGSGSISQSSENKIYDTKPLNILFKSKPKYTDFARFYEIIGNVRTRVTFLKDGTIGSATPVTRLPFGLTNSAIDAAKQMRFEPQIVDGKPVAVTKVVVFNFTIY